VKTRSAGHDRAADALSRSQRRRIRRAAESWIHAHPGVGAEFRFDLISVDASVRGTPRIEHLEGAFFGDEAL
jgi:putative endonuclease